MNVLALDLSLNSSGFCYRSSEQGIVTGTINPSPLMGMERLQFNRNTLRQVVDEAESAFCPVTMVVVEGYAMNINPKKGGRVFSIAEWGGIAKLTLYELGKPLLIAPPAQLKMFATGNGGSAIKKPHIRAAIKDVWGYDIPQDDEADAFVLMHLGEAYANGRIRRGIPQIRKRALEGVEYIPAGV